MWPFSSDAQSLGIDKLPEEIMMLFYSPQSLQAEIAYRQERIKRDYERHFQRPLWFLNQARQAARPAAALPPGGPGPARNVSARPPPPHRPSAAEFPSRIRPRCRVPPLSSQRGLRPTGRP